MAGFLGRRGAPKRPPNGQPLQPLQPSQPLQGGQGGTALPPLLPSGATAPPRGRDQVRAPRLCTPLGVSRHPPLLVGRMEV